MDGVALAAVAVWLGYPWWTLALLLPLVLSLWATFARYCEWWGPMLRSFGSRYREVLLTFDAAPDPDEMPIVLVLLERYRARGLFFVDIERARRNPELVKEIVQKGHGIGLSLPLSRRAGVWHRLPKALSTEVADHVAWLKEHLPGYPPPVVDGRRQPDPRGFTMCSISMGLKPSVAPLTTAACSCVTWSRPCCACAPP